MKVLHVAADLSLPLDAATQTFAFIARKGAGKTYAAGKLVEEFLSADVQVIVLDTVGNWYGLRIGADGQSAGFDIPLLGGLRGDIPLEATGGALIADIAIESGRSMVLDASQFSLTDRKRFAVTFGEELWRRKKGESHPAPLHLVIEESQLIIPQTVQGDTARMVGIYEEIIRLGRNYGIGVSMITQRPQSVNKEVLNQTECLFVGQINGAQERDALKKWITHQGMDPHLVDELPALRVGTFYVWSPQWLRILKKVSIAAKATFDASATPRVGHNQTRREIKPIDLDDLKSKMAATIDRAKENDPKELKQQIEELKRKLARQTPTPPSDGDTQRITAAAKRDARAEWEPLVKERDGTIRELHTKLSRIARSLDKSHAAHEEIAAELGKAAMPELSTLPTLAPIVLAPRREIPAVHRIMPTGRQRRVDGNGHDASISAPQQRILNALAWLEVMNLPAPAKNVVAWLADASSTSSAFSNNLGVLRSAGLIDYPRSGIVELTATGRASASAPTIPLTAGELQDAVLSKVTGPQSRIVDALIQVYPDAMEKARLAEVVNASATSSAFSNNLGVLRSLGLIDYPKSGYVAAKPLLFLQESSR